MSELSRLRWLCRRGMKELDIVMTHFLEQSYPESSEQEKNAFVSLLNLQDPELYALLLDRKTSDDPYENQVLEALRLIKSNR